MDEYTIGIIDRLLQNAIDEKGCEDEFTDALEMMLPEDRAGLVPLMVERAKVLLDDAELSIVTDGIPAYVWRRLAAIDDKMEFEMSDEEEWMEDEMDGEMSMFQLVNEMIDNCVEEHHLSVDFCDRLSKMDDAARLQVCDMIIERVSNDPSCHLPKYERNPVLDEFDALMEYRAPQTTDYEDILPFPEMTKEAQEQFAKDWCAATPLTAVEAYFKEVEDEKKAKAHLQELRRISRSDEQIAFEKEWEKTNAKIRPPFFD